MFSKAFQTALKHITTLSNSDYTKDTTKAYMQTGLRELASQFGVQVSKSNVQWFSSLWSIHRPKEDISCS